MEALLEVTGLTKVFGPANERDCPGVNGVGFQLRAGETLGLVGESGCGKSTLAKLITRQIDPSGGTILLEGQDITRAKGKALRQVYGKMQMVFQSPTGSFDPRRTLGESIGESLKNRGVPGRERNRQVAALLEQCGLSPEFARRYPHEVSGGECQRAAIARGLAIRPRLLICDEATSALDVTVQYQIVELLKALKQEGQLSYLFICHNLALVQSFCDRVLVMQTGKIVEEGTPRQVIQNPRSEYTRYLVESAL